jgi:hypothetical protein
MIQNINLGAAANDKTGDSARSGGDKINKNFAYLEAKIDRADQLISETGFVLVDQNLTMNTGWEWLINDVNYSNPQDVVINIPFAAMGLQRIDLIVLNTSNTFTRVAGIESASNSAAPLVTNDTVQATIILVSDAAINEPAAPNMGSGPGLQEVTNVNARTTNPISIRNITGLNGISIHNFAVSFWKWVNGVSIYSNIRIDNVTQSYEIQLPNKTGGIEQTMAMLSDIQSAQDISGKVDKVTGKSLILDTEITRLAGVSNYTSPARTDVISYALSAPTGNLVIGDVDTFHAPYNFTLNNYWIGVKTPPTISSLLVDIKKSGVSITSTKAGIDATEYTSLTGTTPVLTTTTFVKGDPITPVISQIGSGDTGISLKIYLEVTKS